MENLSNLYDVIIVGGGPAGLSAAIYMARAKYKVLVIEKEKIGGQITITSEIVNYPGVERTSGTKLTQSMKEQAEAFGAEFVMAEVVSMELEKDVKTFHTTQGTYQALGTILALGASPRKLGFKGEKEFQGRGVAYCATCDGEFFTDMDVFVIGGGFAAVEEGIFLTKYARHVTMIVRGDDFTCARTVADQIKNYDKISVRFHTEIVEVSGDNLLSYARFKDNKTGEEWSYDAGGNGGFGIFVFAGYVPNTAWLGDEIERDESGYLVTDVNRRTNLSGVYGAGDVCIKNLRQVVTAVSDGATAATSLEKYVSALHDKLSIPELPRREASLSKNGEQSGEKQSRMEDGQRGKSTGSQEHEGQGFLSAEIRAQLSGIFEKFETPVIVRAYLDESPLSGEMGNFMGELSELTYKISCETVNAEGNTKEQENRLLPSIEICRADGRETGIAFHGVPGGHEFNSFIIALYNAAGPGKKEEPGAEEQIKALEHDVNVKILVSLSCTMCPEVVMAAQRAASLSEHVTAEMVDLRHYPELKKKYQVMSVPCMIVNDSKVYFGKKSFAQVAELIAKEG